MIPGEFAPIMMLAFLGAAGVIGIFRPIPHRNAPPAEAADHIVRADAGEVELGLFVIRPAAQSARDTAVRRYGRQPGAPRTTTPNRQHTAPENP